MLVLPKNNSTCEGGVTEEYINEIVQPIVEKNNLQDEEIKTIREKNSSQDSEIKNIKEKNSEQDLQIEGIKAECENTPIWESVEG